MIDVPEYKFVTISVEGNPNRTYFSEYMGTLYAVSYTIKMTLKKREPKPKGYCDYTVYPLVGVWDITEEAKKIYDGMLNKDDLVFNLMIRQPSFISDAFFEEMLHLFKAKNPMNFWINGGLKNYTRKKYSNVTYWPLR